MAVTRIEGREIAVGAEKGEDAKIAAFIKPYHDHIEADMSTVLAVAPVAIDKTGQWQTPIGNLFADATLQKTDSIFLKRQGRHLDFCMLNSGGVRSIIPAGDVTMRTAYEIMPFENSCIVAEMKPEQIQEMVTYIIGEKKPHPLSGISFSIGKDGRASDIVIAGKPLEANRTYYCVTNDYLYLGGDSMVFFAKGPKSYPLDYKLRNVLIDYFKQVDTVVAPTNPRITVE
nr:5'-nucleotidase [Flavobacterium selenitireducens]